MRISKKRMLVVLLLTLSFLPLSTHHASADCTHAYKKEIDRLEKQSGGTRAVALGDIVVDTTEKCGILGIICFPVMAAGAIVAGVIGSPMLITGTVKNKTTGSDLKAALALITEATSQAQFGPHLEQLHRQLLKKDVNYNIKDLAELLTKANSKNVFCISEELAGYKQIRQWLKEGLLTPAPKEQAPEDHVL